MDAQPSVDSAATCGCSSRSPTIAIGRQPITSCQAASGSGGIANGGIDTSATQTFTLTVNFVNDQPTFSASSQTVNSVNLAILAALNFADELEHLRRDHRELLDHLETLNRRLSQAIGDNGH